MSRDNVEIVRTAVDALNRGDAASLFDSVLDPEIEFVTSGSEVGQAAYRGTSSGIAGESRSGYMLKFKDGKVVTFRPFKEPEKALEGVGLPV